ncbi:hypothetical protein KX729_29530 [Rhizobium sp. XQZ8]|uniref:hypothetical protein n=1 Tax=Rhizobium populisoli TaxID=2859785 RepID=UPI001CA5BDC7|nr:hypothetical protein [Rhizobium populisoli]MBW6425552.1 hypothetical protein [Rhizobium populisoli]
MPGTFTTFYVLAFDLDDRNQPVKAFEPHAAASVEAAVDAARNLSSRHAGVVAWKLESDPVVGEEGHPEVLFQAGRVGDFF